jgi:hypothetical protein
MTRRAAPLIGVLLLLASCTDQPQPAASAPPPCGSPVVTDALPAWARGGFSDDGAGVPHVFGRSGDILGVLFGRTLSAAPAADRGNKILWVTRYPAPGAAGDTLRITAVLAGGAEKAEREVPGGPGPSIIDLPRAGCWRLTLQWNGRTDSMDLTYT